jgi:hypothetical protein
MYDLSCVHTLLWHIEEYSSGRDSCPDQGFLMRDRTFHSISSMQMSLSVKCARLKKKRLQRLNTPTLSLQTASKERALRLSLSAATGWCKSEQATTTEKELSCDSDWDGRASRHAGVGAVVLRRVGHCQAFACLLRC